MAAKVVSRGNYIIRTMPSGPTVLAQIVRGRKMIGPRHVGIDSDTAIEAADVWLRERQQVELAERTATGVPSVSAYREALDAIEMNRGETAMLQAHFAAPWHKLTASELATAAGWPNWSSANLHYGGLGKKFADELDWTPPTRNDGTPIWTMAIAMPANLDDVPAEEAIDFLMSGMENGGEFEWVLRPQLVEALKRPA